MVNYSTSHRWEYVIKSNWKWLVWFILLNLYLDDTILGEISNQFRHLSRRFERLQVSDTWNNVHIRIWTTKIECFKAARVGSIVLVSLVVGETFQCLFYSCTLGVRDRSQLVWIAGCSKLRQNIMATSQLRVCVTCCVTVMVIYYTWTDNHNSSIFIRPTMSSDITIVSHLLTDTRHLLGLWLHRTNQDDSSGLPQMPLQLNEGSSTQISTLPCPPVVAGGRQGLMHSHSHPMTTSPWSHSGHAFSRAA